MLKTLTLRLFDRAVTRARKVLLYGYAAPWWDQQFDVVELAALEAGFESARYYRTRMQHAKAYDNSGDLLRRAIELASPNGMFLGFGVATGRTINHIASIHKGAVHGFDSFEGLPESWYGNFGAGRFAGELPKVPDNVQLIKGLFEDTLPDFIQSRSDEAISFLHIDCDLYSSTKTIFNNLGSRVRPGCVIVFDEYFNYPGWSEHEAKAFAEFIAASNLAYSYVGFVRRGQQVCVVITERQTQSVQG